MADVPILVCTAGPRSGLRVRVPEGGLDVGRSSENGLVLDDDGVSRFHARLIYDNGSLWLQDAGSRNGLFVNEVRVTGHQALKVDDVITIADHEFTIRWDADEEPSEVRPTQPEPQPTPRPKKRWYWPF